jgi:hypothetical protein
MPGTASAGLVFPWQDGKWNSRIPEVLRPASLLEADSRETPSKTRPKDWHQRPSSDLTHGPWHAHDYIHTQQHHVHIHMHAPLCLSVCLSVCLSLSLSHTHTHSHHIQTWAYMWASVYAILLNFRSNDRRRIAYNIDSQGFVSGLRPSLTSRRLLWKLIAFLQEPRKPNKWMGPFPWREGGSLGWESAGFSNVFFSGLFFPRSAPHSSSSLGSPVMTAPSHGSRQQIKC